MGWINKKEFDDSIVSSWLLHGIVNYLASIYVMEMFVIREKDGFWITIILRYLMGRNTGTKRNVLVILCIAH